MAKKKKTTKVSKLKKKAKTAKKKVAKKATPKKVTKKKAVKKKMAKKATVSKKKAAKKKVAKKAVPKKVAKKTAKKTVAKKVKKSATSKKVKTAKKAVVETKPSGKKTKKTKAVEVVEELEADFLSDEELDDVQTQIDEGKAEDVILTDAEGNRYCRVRDCDQLAIVDAYCRYHYLLFWKKIQVRKKILTEGKLQKYIEDLTARYPDKFLEILRKDLRSEKDFLAAIMELELDEASNDDSNYEDEEDRSFIDEVRGVTESARSSRDDDDY